MKQKQKDTPTAPIQQRLRHTNEE